MPHVAPNVLLDGLAMAHERLSIAEGDAVFIAVFEALNWVVTIDDLFGPRTGDRENWLENAVGAPDTAGQTALWGLRYVRNSVHHHWGDALEWANPPGFDLEYGHTMGDWVWRGDIPRPRVPRGKTEPPGETEYQHALVGMPAADTIRLAGILFVTHHNLVTATRPEYLESQLSEIGFAESGE